MHINAVAGVAFDVLDQSAFTHARKTHCNAGATSTAGTSDTVNIVFSLTRQIEVDDMADTRHVNTTRCNVSRHQHLGAAFAQALQCTVTLTLLHIAMQRIRSKAAFCQQIRNLFGAALGRSKHDGLGHLHSAQQGVEQTIFVIHVVSKQQTLLDLGFLHGHSRNFNALCVTRQFACQVAHHAVERRREQQGLTLFRAACGNRLDVIDKAHVQHAVGFIQHQHFQAREINLAALQMVNQAAGGSHHHINRLAQTLELQAIRRATHQTGGAKAAHVLAIGHGSFFNLQRQFAGRRQHQHARAHALAGRFGQQALDRRQQERCGLAAAGIRRHQQVAAGQRGRNRLHLNRCGVFVASGQNGFKDKGVKTQFGKAHV